MRRLILLIILILAACSPEPSTRATFATGELRLRPPDGWIVETRQLLLIANNQAVLDNMLTRSPIIQTGEVFLSINAFIPQAYPGLTNSSSLFDVLNIATEEIRNAYPVGFDTVQFFNIENEDALYITGRAAQFDVTIVIVRLDKGFAIMNVFTATGEFEAFKTDIATLIPTLKFE